MLEVIYYLLPGQFLKGTVVYQYILIIATEFYRLVAAEPEGSGHLYSFVISNMPDQLFDGPFARRIAMSGSFFTD
jgi:hypothetical protein